MGTISGESDTGQLDDTNAMERDARTRRAFYNSPDGAGTRSRSHVRVTLIVRGA